MSVSAPASTLLELLGSAQASDHGVRVGERFSSYEEVIDSALRLAAGFNGIGVQRGDTVGVLLPNGLEFVVTLLAVNHLGATALPLNPAYERGELQFYGDRTRASTLVVADDCVRKGRAVAEHVSAPIRIVSATRGGGGSHAIDDLIAGSARAPTSERGGIGPSVYFHSSGSTGRPKVIPRTWAQLLAEAEALGRRAAITRDDVIFCAVPLFHAHGFGNCLLAALRSGASLTLLPPGPPLSVRADAVLSILERERVTFFPGVPFLFDALLRSRRRGDLSGVRTCFSAGTALKKDVFDEFLRRFDVPIRQLYGCSEAGAVTLDTGDEVARTWDSVGPPLPGVRLAIDARDAEGVGEVVLRAPSLTEGYLGQADENRAVFRDGAFLTGDLGRLDAEGRLYLTGRRRLFVEVAGNKVDPFEVEDVLCEHADIAEAVVVGVPAERGPGERLKAVLVVRTPVAAEAVQAHCRGRLASFKVPDVVEFRAELPKSPLGKVLRKYLL